MQDRRGKESLAAPLDPLLQILLHPVLIIRRHGPHPLRQITKTKNRRFNLADAAKARQLIKPPCEVPRQFDVAFDRFAVSALAHELETHPQLERIEASRTHLPVPKKIIFRVREAAILA